MISERIKNICSLIIRLNPNITNLKLQKLLYIIQASSIHYLDCPAFIDTIEAWQYGPVVPSVYYEYMFNIDNLKCSQEIQDKDLIELINIINKNLGNKTSYELVSLTQSYSSWKNAWNIRQGEVITMDNIKECHNKIAQEKNGFIL